METTRTYILHETEDSMYTLSLATDNGNRRRDLKRQKIDKDIRGAKLMIISNISTSKLGEDYCNVINYIIFLHEFVRVKVDELFLNPQLN